MRRVIDGNVVTLTDAAGGRYTYVLAGEWVTLIRDAAGRIVSTRTYDAMGRVMRVSVLGAVEIDYAYTGEFDWSEKVVSLAGGQMIGRFTRQDYPDPDLDGIHAQFRGPTGEPVASFDGSQWAYSAGVLTPYVSLSSNGHVLARSFAFGSAVPYSDDEITILADGSVRVRPALPHGEFTHGQSIPSRLRFRRQRHHLPK